MQLRPSTSRSSITSWVFTFSALLLLAALPIHAIELDLESDESIKSAAKTLARGCKSYYTGDNPGDVPGNLPSPYYWWEAGALFGAFIDYWFYTGDDTYNDITMQAMIHQASEDRDFMPTNQTKTEGNDDQAFWAMSAMSAAERNFPNPSSDQPQWLALVQAVFNLQVARWDKGTCGGGLKWQIFRFNNGFNYKNTISNGCFFNMAARLATYTGNATYAEWAEIAWDWMESVGFVTENFHFLDGADDTKNCTQINRIQWTYNAGVCLLGAAHMFQFTNNSDKWKKRVQGIKNGLDVFFFKETNIMFEVPWEPNGKWEKDQRSFKAYLARWMAATTQVAPFTAEQLMPKLQASALAAAKVCTGSTVGQQCPLKWTTETFEGETGLGEQMAALEVIQSNLISKTPPPLTNLTGGTSPGDPNAGLQRGHQTPDIATRKITAGDRAGAVILTVLLILVLLVSPYWLLCV
ncbi:hypothetical protein PAAG_11309 [Paracoccidioides lutzii Pb01]|uniref:Mannan endo-1,6-alpha-mannosidase n=1 Tax=Paracoccidioides lutzii (strain ATCC MYA-826 / Pb01) TaxID=502779 RepID=A0A0A2VM24_PARBA|nr:hypothetical protein PAAG_11309 [Paracoccidioides lutzii Pb01]KGQ01919.1 hypothetical protein PAAG_11309 [Paracoccidioides lutzii Pb01]